MSRIAKQKNLKRLSTNIPKYQVSVKEYIESENSNLEDNPDRTNDNPKEKELNQQTRLNESSKQAPRLISKKEVKELLGEKVENNND